MDDLIGSRLDSALLVFSDRRLERAATFSIPTNSENAFIDDLPSSSDHPPQPQTHSSESFNDNPNFGYTPQEPFVYNQDPCEIFFTKSSTNQPTLLLWYPVIHHPPQETSVEMLQARENLMKSIQTFLKKFNRISFRETPKVLSLAWEKCFEIQHAFREKQHQPEDIQEWLRKLLKDVQIISEELATYINSPSWNCPAFYDDDNEYTIQYREYFKNSSNAITLDLPTEKPDNSLSMGDEHLSTISETESDEVIKSSVEDLVLIPSESEGISDDTCDVPFCDNSPPLDDIDYIEASPPDSELVSLEEVKDDILREKLLNINLLIAKIKSLNDNPIPDCVLKSLSSFPIPTFSNHTEETNSGSTTTHADNSRPMYDSFFFEIKPNQGELTSVVMEDILGEPHVYVPNVLPTDPTFMLDSDFIPFDDSLGSDLEDCPDCEDSRARGFVLRSLDLHILSMITGI
nr:hypothetical protein [Tanacetum cinerariifolium]